MSWLIQIRVFWAIDDPKTLELGENTVDWGPFEGAGQKGLEYMIRVDADDSVTFDSFVASDGSGSTGSGGSGSGSSSDSGILLLMQSQLISMM